MDIFVKRPVLSIVISLTLIIAGISAAMNIGMQQYPQIESSSLVVSTIYTGASAEVVQGFITEPIERVAMSVPGVDYVDSQTTAGTSTVTAWLELNEDGTAALAELSARLDQIRYELPSGAEDPAVTVKRADRSSALFYLEVDGIEHWGRAPMTDYLSRNVTPLFSSIEGVQSVEIFGGRKPSMRVWIDPMKLSAANLGASDILTALQTNNVIASLGKTENARQQIHLLTNATLQTVADFEQLVIKATDSGTIRLRDIARIEQGEGPGTTTGRSNQNITIYLAISPLPGANEIEVGDMVYSKLDQINKSLPRGVEIKIDYDGTKYMRHALTEIFKTLGETVVLVGIVVFLCMGSFRSSLVPLVTIPISILGGVAVMYAVGFSLNLLTVLAIVLSVGLVVDDAIVVVENVARHMRNGSSRTQAALDSSRELLAPVIGMTLTLAAVYAPIGFVSGLAGALFREFAFALAITVVISGIVAVTLSPIMSAYVSPTRGREGWATRFVNRLFDRLVNMYTVALEIAFRWRNQILFAGVFGTLLLVPFYLFSSKELAPTEDQGSILVIAESPPDASLAYTTGQMNEIVDAGLGLPGADRMWQAILQQSSFCGIELVDYEHRDQSTQELLPQVFAKLSGIAGLRGMPMLPPALPSAGQFDVELVVKSSASYTEMNKYAQELLVKAQQSGSFMFVDTSLKMDQPQVRLDLDHERISDLGLDVQTVSDQLGVFVSEQYVNRFNADGKAYRVIPMIESSLRANPASLLDLQLKTSDGMLIPVRSIAKLKDITGPRSLGRFNQQRSFRILGGTASGVTKGQALTTLERIARKTLPAEYVVDYAGESRQLRTEGNSLFSVLVIALGVVYLLMAVQFNSFRLPLVVLLGSVPLALSAALLFSFLGWTTLNMYTQIGCITLVGLIAKNGILITEFANELQHKGISKIDAIISATQVRLRPVVMTTLATVIGHFPLVMVTGAGAEARNSIGITLVAGMAIGTVFTLFVLPCVYLAIAKPTSRNQKPTELELNHDEKSDLLLLDQKARPEPLAIG